MGTLQGRPEREKAASVGVYEAERLESVSKIVEADEFYDDEPGPPKATEGVHQAPTLEGRRAPYTITVSLFVFRQISSLWVMSMVVTCDLHTVFYERTGTRTSRVVERRRSGDYG